MNLDEYCSLSAMEMAALVQARQVKPSELLELAVQAHQKTHPHLNAVTQEFVELAERQLDDLDMQSPLSGVPFLIKDLWVQFQGIRTTQGSRAFKNSPPSDIDNHAVERFKRSGMVIFGSTSSPEMGMTVTTEPVAHGKTHSPWNTDYSSGGSSGGAGAACAAGVVPVAHATDGGGSIRIPASCCGLFGLKPTRGRTPSGPRVGEGWFGCSIGHVVSHTVRDSAVVLDALAGDEHGAPYCAPAKEGSFLSACDEPPRPLRIGYSAGEFVGVMADSEVADCLEKFVVLLAELGHKVDRGYPQFDAEAARQAFGAVLLSDAARVVGDWEAEAGRSATNEDFERSALAYAAMGKEVGAVDLIKAVQTFHGLSRAMADWFDHHDIFVCPVLAKPPVKLGWIDMNSEDSHTYNERLQSYTPYCSFFNMSGNPAASIPVGMSAEGLPIGIMVVAPFGGERTIYRLAAQLEQAISWKSRRPAIWAADL